MNLIRPLPEARMRAALKIEIENYMELQALPILVDEKPTDPLLWWMLHATEFPRLSQLARACLAAPATSAPVERFFSHAGNVITENRARLKSDIAADLVLLHDSWGVCADLLPTVSEATREAPKRPIEDVEDGSEESDEEAAGDESDELF